ncbi:hypothetical protein DNTS_016994 [Danionella cerebrum]|uniref:Uncharacterized protein n=1 Tax=Danionella cerebrum TaxID=2873325 RepID=A0A553R9S8_9TELE|nr:hypothetical protein DNTS_016994 [Danionella translucida]
MGGLGGPTERFRTKDNGTNRNPLRATEPSTSLRGRVEKGRLGEFAVENTRHIPLI